MAYKNYLNAYDEDNIYMPNEIFNDLIGTLSNKDENGKLKYNNSKHIAFTYSYYYLTAWLYRYTKYCNVLIDKKVINQILGYGANYRDADYIIKKNGVLDQLHYTKTTTEYPAFSVMDEDNNPVFTYYHEVSPEESKYYHVKPSKNNKIKLPLKHFHRSKDSFEDGYEDGLFFEIENSHYVPFEVFMFCMSNKKLGCMGFYIYSFLKCKNQHFKNGYDVSLKNFEIETGINRRTLCQYIDALRKHNMIQVQYNQEYFCLILEPQNRKANTYIVNSPSKFSETPLPYEKMKVLKKDDYKKILDKKAEDMDLIREPIDIPLDQLPY